MTRQPYHEPPDPPDYDAPCPTCGLWEDSCICPECPTCGSFGDPVCYEKHGLVRTKEQIDSLANQEARWEYQAEQEADYWDEMYREEQERLDWEASRDL